ncbi:MAG: hypothetical protein IJU51_02225 [Clostridia bacterium]|nr:hypothetical protein [Clostridia bacterium]
MNTEPEKYCISCMQSIGAEEQCPFCGFKRSSYVADVGVMKPDTLFESRYHVGAAYMNDGVFTSYSAYDNIMKRRVVLRVFSDGSTDYEHYSRKGRFQDTYKRLALMDMVSFPKVYTCKAFEGGAYAVCEYVSEIRLSQEIAKNGKMSFEDAKSLLLPVIVTLKLMHDERLVHGCVCADAVRRKDKTVLLCDASGSAGNKFAADDVREFLRLFVAVMYGSPTPVPLEFIKGAFTARNELSLPPDALECFVTAFDSGGIEATSDFVLRKLYHCSDIALGVKKQPAKPPESVISYAVSQGVAVKGLITSLT